MESKTTINQRFIEAVNYLILVKSVKNKSELAQNLKLGKTKFSEILNERMNVGIDTVALFCLLYEIRVEWLLNGKGKMVRPGEFVPKSDDLKIIYAENIEPSESLDQESRDLANARLETIIKQDKIILLLENEVERLRQELLDVRTNIKESASSGDLESAAVSKSELKKGSY